MFTGIEVLIIGFCVAGITSFIWIVALLDKIFN
jgi:hypothetical protein